MCCGAKPTSSRTSFSSPARGQRPMGTSAPTPGLSTQPASVIFEYTGAAGLTVVSPTTAKRYCFDTPGAQLSVDPQDHALMLYVPNLRPASFTRNS